MQNLAQHQFVTQFNEVRVLEQNCGIAKSCDSEIFLAVCTLASRFKTTFEAALSSLINELEALAESKTDSEGGEHD